MKKTIFERIADRELPGFIVWEDEFHIAFLTIEPLSEGHTLVVPKKNIGGYLFDLSESDFQALMTASKKVAVLLKKSLHCERILMVVEGVEVPHVHIHLVPAVKGKFLSQLKPRQGEMATLERVKRKIISGRK